MPSAVRLGDVCSGHGCFPSRPSISASPDVFVEDIPSHRVGDMWDSHCCGGCHQGIAVSGSPDVFVNDQPKCRIGDQIDCGSIMIEGATTVNVND